MIFSESVIIFVLTDFWYNKRNIVVTNRDGVDIVF